VLYCFIPNAGSYRASGVRYYEHTSPAAVPLVGGIEAMRKRESSKARP